MTKNSNDAGKKPRRYPKFPPAGVRFEALDGRGLVTMATAEAARLTSSSMRTVNRWRREGRIPAAALTLLQLHHAGYIVPESWRGAPCAFTRLDTLVIGGYVFARGELEGYGVMLGALRTLQREREALAKGQAVPDGRPALSVLPGGRREP